VAELVVQVQADRLREFSDETIEQLRWIQTPQASVQNVCVSGGNDDGRYINVHFETDDLRSLWSSVREQIVCLGLQAAVIVTCTGSEGSDNYLTLHHFDRQEPIDELAAS